VNAWAVTAAKPLQRKIPFHPQKWRRKPLHLCYRRAAMKKLLPAALLAALAVFFWGFLSHTVFGWHMAHYQPVKDEAAVFKVLSENLPSDGMVRLPGLKNPDGSMRTMEDWEKLTGTVPYLEGMWLSKGMPMNMGSRMALNFGLNLVIALLIGFMFLNLSGMKLRCRMMMGGMLGVLAWLFSWGPQFVWYDLPAVHILPYLVDYTVSGLLCGFILGRLLPPGRSRCETLPLPG
jgi:hypothetical protein